MARRTIKELNQEVMDLKACQIDMLNLALRIFTFVSMFITAAIAALFKIAPNWRELLTAPYRGEVYLLVSVLLMITLTTPIIFPIFIRIILHKCRSIFRLLGYIRLAEEYERKNITIIPYEYGYALIRCHPILTERIPSSHGIKLIFWEKPWDFIRELFLAKGSKLINRREARNNIRALYTGRYYSNLSFFLKILAGIHLFIFAFLCYLILKHTDSELVRWVIGILDGIVFLWCWYNLSLIHRYFYEIMFCPFSIHSWYCLFKVINLHYLADNLDQVTNETITTAFIKCLNNRCQALGFGV